VDQKLFFQNACPLQKQTSRPINRSRKITNTGELRDPWRTHFILGLNVLKQCNKAIIYYPVQEAGRKLKNIGRLFCLPGLTFKNLKYFHESKGAATVAQAV
jgi:hypothetical protein